MNSYFFPLLVCTICLLSCRKEDNGSRDEKKVVELDKTALSYFQLRTGQYFIYKDTASGKTDSVVVTQSSISNVPFSQWGIINGIEEIYELTLTKKNRSPDSTWLKAKADPNAFGTGATYLVDRDDNVLFCMCSEAQHLSSFAVEGQTYQNVQMVHRAFTNEESYTYYWAKNVGIVKFIRVYRSVPKTYVLLRHN